MLSSELRRKLFFWTLVCVFFIITPTIIAYSFGYRYSNEHGIFIYSGSITIKPNPVQVSIDIDGSPTPKRKLNYLNNSYHIGSLKPGSYTVTVQAPGYTNWSKQVFVRSGISTEFWNVILANKNPEITEYSTPNIAKFFPAPETSLYAYTTQVDEIFSVYQLNTQTNESRHIFSTEEYAYTKQPYKNIEWSPQSESIIIPVTTIKEESILPEEESFQDTPFSRETFIIIDTERNSIISLLDLYPQMNISSVRWSPKEENVLYFLSNTDLMKMNVTQSETPLLVRKNVAAYDFSEDILLTIHAKTGIISSQEIEQSKQEQLTTTALPAIEQCDFSCRLIGYDDKRVALLHTNGDLYLYNKGEKATYALKNIQESVQGIQFSDDGKKLLFWTNHEIFVHFLRQWDAQPYREENETLSVARFYSPISQLQWSKEYEHILFRLDNNIQLIELDHRDKNNIQTLYSLTSDTTEIFGDFRENLLYFIDKQKDECCSNLYSFEFPEKTGLLGR